MDGDTDLDVDTLEFITRASIWLSVALWAATISLRWRGRPGPGARLLWTLGLAAYAVHVVAAFQRFYHWQHTIALAETARRTLATTGFDSGAGLWLNYLLGVVWLADASFWWFWGHSRYSQRSRFNAAGIDGFFAFMIFNGTVVFGQSPAVRVFGGLVFVSLAALAIQRRLRPATDNR